MSVCAWTGHMKMHGGFPGMYHGPMAGHHHPSMPYVPAQPPSLPWTGMQPMGYGPMPGRFDYGREPRPSPPFEPCMPPPMLKKGRPKRCRVVVQMRVCAAHALTSASVVLLCWGLLGGSSGDDAGGEAQQVLPLLPARKGAGEWDAGVLQQGLHTALLRALPQQEHRRRRQPPD
eukprot:2858815-Rhodomonas_salina.1